MLHLNPRVRSALPDKRKPQTPPDKHRSNKPFEWVASNLNYSFRDAKLVEQAFAINGHPTSNHQRMEFIGDPLLALCVGDIIKSPDENAFKKMTTNNALRRWANSRGIHKIKGAIRSASRKSTADTMEAIIGAAYIDGGYEASRIVVNAYLNKNRIGTAKSNNSPDEERRYLEWLGHKALRACAACLAFDYYPNEANGKLQSAVQSFCKVKNILEVAHSPRFSEITGIDYDSNVYRNFELYLGTTFMQSGFNAVKDQIEELYTAPGIAKLPKIAVVEALAAAVGLPEQESPFQPVVIYSTV